MSIPELCAFVEKAYAGIDAFMEKNPITRHNWKGDLYDFQFRVSTAMNAKDNFWKWIRSLGTYDEKRTLALSCYILEILYSKMSLEFCKEICGEKADLVWSEWSKVENMGYFSMNGLFKAYFVPWAEKNVNMSQLDARSKIVKYPIFFKSSILPCILSTIPTEPKKNGVLRNISLLKSLALHPPISRERPSVPIPSVPIPSVPIPSVPTPSVPTPSVPTPSVPTPSVPTPSVPTLKPTPKPKPSQSKPPSRPTKPSSQPQGVVIRKNDPKKQHPQPLPPDQRVRSLNQLRALFGEKAKSEIRNRVKTYAELKSYKLGKRM